MLQRMEINFNDARMRARVFKVLGALAAVIVLGIVSVFFLNNVIATPVSPHELEIRGWVNDLHDQSLTPTRQQAQQKLEEAGNDAVPALLTALRANDPIMRRNAADMLGYIASPVATDGLKQALSSDPVPEVRANAAWSLGEIKAVSSYNLLTQSSVVDGNAQVRKNAADSLAVIQEHLAGLANKDPQDVNSITVAPSQQNTVYLTTKRDILTSHDSGASWNTQAQALPGLTASLTVNPTNPGILYAGMITQGMYLSTDAGQTWQSLTHNFSSQDIGLSTVTAVTVDPANPMRVVMAHGIRIGDINNVFYPLGILSSNDGGKTWDYVLDLQDGQTVTQLSVQNNKVYALTQDKVLVAQLPE